MGYFESSLTVRYVETDQMGIAHHSNYFAWFEVGRTDFIASAGIRYSQVEEMGVLMPLVHCDCRFLKGAKYEDSLLIRTSINELKYSSIAFLYELFFQPEQVKLAEGHTRHAFTNKNLQPISLKKNHPLLWEKFQALNHSTGS